MSGRLVFLLILMLGWGPLAAQEMPPVSRHATKHAAGAATPARELFGSVAAPAPLAASAIGSYSSGCLAGGVALPINGPAWQVMRLSRNRHWGHPRLVAYLQRLAEDARRIGWPGLLIGDLAQPRGGPMRTGHTSHQIGLDADIWLTPMPHRRLTREEREEMTAVSMLRDPFNVDRKLWTPIYTRLLKLAASYPEVDRIFVHPAIKQALCDQAGRDRAWLSKVRPWWGHYYHFHVRLACPPRNGCRSQSPAPQGDGCKAELDEWFARLVEAEFEHDRRAPATRPNRGLMLGDLPKECRAVLTWGGPVASVGRLANDKPAGPPPPRLQFRGGLLQDGPPSSIWGD